MRLARARDITVNAVQAGGARDTERVLARDRADGPRRVHVDPAGRRQDRRDRDALRPRDHRAAGPHQPHRRALRLADAAARRFAMRVQAMRRRHRRRSPPTWRATCPSARHGPGASPRRSPAPATSSATSPADGNRCRRCRSRNCPTTCGAMSPSERQAHIDRQMSERRTLNERLSALVQPARPPHRRHAQQGAAADGGFVRPRGRADAAVADRAVTRARGKTQEAGARCAGLFRGSAMRQADLRSLPAFRHGTIVGHSAFYVQSPPPERTRHDDEPQRSQLSPRVRA